MLWEFQCNGFLSEQFMGLFYYSKKHLDPMEFMNRIDLMWEMWEKTSSIKYDPFKIDLLWNIILFKIDLLQKKSVMQDTEFSWCSEITFLIDITIQWVSWYKWKSQCSLGIPDDLQWDHPSLLQETRYSMICNTSFPYCQ